MKSKNIPPDIIKKTLKEAQNEIKSIILELENNNNDQDQIKNKYTRLTQLDTYIKAKFKERSSEINKIFRNKNGDIIFKTKN